MGKFVKFCESNWVLIGNICLFEDVSGGYRDDFKDVLRKLRTKLGMYC